MFQSADISITVKGERRSFSTPEVMGILNVTPDSFYAGSRRQTAEAIAERVHEILDGGATIIDIGAYSTRPGAMPVSEEEEMARLEAALKVVRAEAPDAVLSIDTFRPEVARMCVEKYGADIINDVGNMADSTDGDTERERMFRFVAEKNIPYILMSRAATMEEMKREFADSLSTLRQLGATNIVLDPGYGFGKTVEQNYAVLARQQELLEFGCPLLVGVSRKRMVWQLLGSDADNALNGTTAVNVLALERGAHILRVHDVKPAAEAIKIYTTLYTLYTTPKECFSTSE